MKDFYLLFYILVAIFFILNGFVKLFHFPFQKKIWREYGYQLWLMTVVGLLELFCALGLLLGLVFPIIAFIAAGVLSMLMIGAIYTHLVKAKQQPAKTIPALICLVLLIIIMSVSYYV